MQVAESAMRVSYLEELRKKANMQWILSGKDAPDRLQMPTLSSSQLEVYD